MPLVLPLSLLAAWSPSVYRLCTRAALFASWAGRPLCLAWAWWWYIFAFNLVLWRMGGSRLLRQSWLQQTFGGGDYFLQGEGPWVCSYALVDKLLRSEQERQKAIGCNYAPVPDIFPSELLVFLPNGPAEAASEWASIRRSLHHLLLDRSGTAWQERLAQLPARLAAEWPQAAQVAQVEESGLLKATQPTDLENTGLLRRMVAKCIFFMLLGVWPTDDEATMLVGWRSMGAYFFMPRLVQRLILNSGVGKIKRLRRETLRLVEKYELQGLFLDFNRSLPPQHRRHSAVDLCDQLMFGVGFAGIGGTAACVEAAGRFLQAKLSAENQLDHISLGRFGTPGEMLAAYRADPFAYLKECCRLAPPVTSGTAPMAEDTAITLNGQRVCFARGTLQQYVISLANRDPSVFQEPLVFNPQRPDLDRALTWNGAFGVHNDEQLYPRLCPGRFLALEVAKAVLDCAILSVTSGP